MIVRHIHAKGEEGGEDRVPSLSAASASMTLSEPGVHTTFISSELWGIHRRASCMAYNGQAIHICAII